MTHAASVFRSFFKHATGRTPYDYQIRLAIEDDLSWSTGKRSLWLAELAGEVGRFQS